MCSQDCCENLLHFKIEGGIDTPRSIFHFSKENFGYGSFSGVEYRSAYEYLVVVLGQTFKYVST